MPKPVSAVRATANMGRRPEHGANLSEEQPENLPTVERRIWRLEHVFALLTAIAVGIAIYRFTGETDIFLAVGSGVGMGAVTWIASWLHLRRRA